MGKKIFLFLVLFMWSFSANAEVLMHKFNVHIGIFDAAEITLVYDGNDKQFAIGADILTVNLFDTLYPFLGQYKSKGLFENEKIIPELYQTYTKSRNHVRTKKIFYDKKGIAYKRVSTKDKKVSEAVIDNVPASSDAADLQSVFANLIKIVKLTQKCELNREIYDGKKHYNVVVRDDGVKKQYFDFLGREDEGHLCAVFIENLKDNNDNILWDVSADKPIKLWIKQDEKTKMPFVLEIRIDSTPLGALKMVPTTININ